MKTVVTTIALFFLISGSAFAQEFEGLWYTEHEAYNENKKATLVLIKDEVVKEKDEEGNDCIERYTFKKDGYFYSIKDCQKGGMMSMGEWSFSNEQLVLMFETGTETKLKRTFDVAFSDDQDMRLTEQ